MIDLIADFNTVTSAEWIKALMLIGAIMLFVIGGEVIFKFFPNGKRYSRKFVHITVGVFVGLLPFFQIQQIVAISIGAFFAFSNLAALKVGLFKGIHHETRSWGTVFFPLSFLFLCFVSWDNPLLITLPMVAMAVGDGFSALVGENVKNPISVFPEIKGKSRQGSSTMALVSFSILTFYVYMTPGISFGLPVLVSILIGTLVITTSEMVSWRGSDNLSVPFFTWIMLRLMIENYHVGIVLAALLAALVAWLAFHMKALDRSGMLSVFLLGFLFFSVGAVPWSVPILTFFIFSSLISKLPWKNGDTEKVFEKSSRRDVSQVLANGGIPGIMLILHWLTSNHLFYDLHIIALAGATADTWATEFGSRFATRQPFHLRLLKRVEAGTSGAVSITGFIASFAGGALIGLVAIQWTALPWYMAGLGGLIVSVIDSLLGAYLQKQYICTACGSLTEKSVHCNIEIQENQKNIYGLTFLSNNRVNLFSIFSGCIVLYYSVIL